MKDIGKFRDVPLKPQPSVVNLAGSIDKRATETQLVGMRCTKVISQ